MRSAIALVSVALLAGCGGESESAPATEPTTAPATTQAETTGAEPTGRELFVQNCSGCHTLKDAGTTGKVGPNLDQKKPTKARVLFMLENGGGGGLGVMPKFKGTLSDAQLQAVATYVSSVAGSS
jgi:mono/diheme cytochrome c family protein